MQNNLNTSFNGKIRLNFGKIEMQIKISCHQMLSSHFKIKLILPFNCNLNINSAAHMCAFENFSNFKNTSKLVKWYRLFYNNQNTAFYEKM